MERESFGSRLGFILLSAGCAIGIGNVWKFPYLAGSMGGGAFVLLYLIFLVVLGIPLMTMEFAVGRASRKSGVNAFQQLQKPGQKWHINGVLGLAGCYIMLMMYTVVGGWMLHYCWLFASGQLAGLDAAGIGGMFDSMLASTPVQLFWAAVTVVFAFVACWLGLQNGVETISKWLMLILLGLIVVLAGYAMTLDGAGAGLAFYLVPSMEKVNAAGGLASVATAAMNQCFFSLSIGIGAMTIFGSYQDKKRALGGEAIRIGLLDTFVAISAGLIIFPSCFTYGVQPDAGPRLVFLTLPNVFNAMPGGRVWGALFFLFMSFAALTTILAVFENLVASCMELFGWQRQKSALINLVIVAVSSLPCILGFSTWTGFTPFGPGTGVMDLEDFIVNNLLLPIGCLLYVLFCTHKKGWGFDNYLEETNTGAGFKIPRAVQLWLSYGVPVLILILLLSGLWDKAKAVMAMFAA